MLPIGNITNILKLPIGVNMKGDIYMKNLKKMRISNNMTQEFVAQAMGISRSRYLQIENMKKEPGIYTVERYADFFNVSIDELIGREFPKKK